VLRWMLCPPEIMRAQLDRLQTVVGLSTVRFGIIPMTARIAITPQNSFQMYDDIAIVETFVGEITYRADDAEVYGRVMERLWEQAATGDEARRLIVAAAEAVAG
jgi:hypothetical protein